MSGSSSAIDSYLSVPARTDLARAIQEAEGNEVFFVGRSGASGKVEGVEVLGPFGQVRETRK